VVDIEVTRRFGGAPEEVFRAYLDDSGWAQKDAIEGARAKSDEAAERDCVGAVRVVGIRGMQLHEQLVELEQPARLAYKVIRGAVGFRKHFGEVLFEPAGEGTLVRWRVRLEPILPMTGWLLEAATTRLFRTSLEALARRHFPD
jgi:hypothetical protein